MVLYILWPTFRWLLNFDFIVTPKSDWVIDWDKEEDESFVHIMMQLTYIFLFFVMFRNSAGGWFKIKAMWYPPKLCICVFGRNCADKKSGKLIELGKLTKNDNYHSKNERWKKNTLAKHLYAKKIETKVYYINFF